MKRFLVLDSLRGLCALGLVAHHTRTLQGFSEWPLLRNASLLVAFLFALSGFLLYRKYMNRLGSGEQLQHFAISRLCRVYPLHALMLLVFIGFECLKLALSRYGMSVPNPPFSGDRAVSEIGPNLLLLQAWWPGFNSLSFNYPAWFVSVGFYLSLLFGLLAFAMPVHARKAFALIALSALLALHWHNTWLTAQVLTGLACFFAGGVTYRLYIRLQYLTIGPLCANVLEVGILGLMCFVMITSEAPSTVDIGLLSCVAILIFSREAGWLSRLASLSVLIWLGKRWLSIYMTHAAVIFVTSMGLTLLAKATGRVLHNDVVDPVTGLMVRYINTGSALNDNLVIVFVMAAVIVLSMFTYRYVELPGVALGKRWNQRRTVAHAGGQDTGSQA